MHFILLAPLLFLLFLRRDSAMEHCSRDHQAPFDTEILLVVFTLFLNHQLILLARLIFPLKLLFSPPSSSPPFLLSPLRHSFFSSFVSYRATYPSLAWRRRSSTHLYLLGLWYEEGGGSCAQSLDSRSSSSPPYDRLGWREALKEEARVEPLSGVGFGFDPKS